MIYYAHCLRTRKFMAIILLIDLKIAFQHFSILENYLRDYLPAKSMMDDS